MNNAGTLRSQLVSLASAIRSKASATGTYTISGMASAVIGMRTAGSGDIGMISFSSGYANRMKFPDGTYIEGYFDSSYTAYIPGITSVPNNFGQSVTTYPNLYFPDATIIGDYFLQSAYRMAGSVKAPNVTRIGTSAFNFNRYTDHIGLHTFAFPECSVIGTYCFNYSSAVVTAYFPKITYVPSWCFSSVSSYFIVYLGSVSYIGKYALRIGGTLYNATLYILGSSIPVIHSSAVYLGSQGHIYVPPSMVNDYKTNTYWSKYKSLISSSPITYADMYATAKFKAAI